MTHQEIKNFINTYIVSNGVGAITGALLNTILNELADYYGFDSVIVTTLPAGSDATVNVQGKTLELGIPKGEDGENGMDAVNPFKGWFTTDNIPTTGQGGDYCNVTDTQTQTVTIYRWDTTQNKFVDTGEVPDTATGETFASGETLQQVAIDDSHLVNPMNTVDATQPVLAQADDVMDLKAKLEGVTASEVKVPLVASGDGKNYYSALYVRVDQSKIDYTSAGTPKNGVIIFNVSNVKRVRFLGMQTDASTNNVGYGFCVQQPQGLSNTPLDMVFAFDSNAPSLSKKQYIVDVPEGMNWMVITVRVFNNQLMTIDEFYCYNQYGESVKEEIDCISNSINRADNISVHNSYRLSKFITLNSEWSTAGKSSLIPVSLSRGKILHITKAINSNTHYAFLTEYPSGDSVPYASGTTLNFLTDSNKEVYVTIPNDAQYLYLKREENNVFFGPASVQLIDDEFVVKSNHIGQYDTYIEENIYRYESAVTGSGQRVKLYKIDKELNYKLILRMYDTDSGARIVYYDNLLNQIGTDFIPDGTSEFFEMVNISIPSNCQFIKLSVTVKEGNPSDAGCGALMKPLQDDGTLPLNLINYCVSKVRVPLIPNGYDGEQTYPQNDVWSAWAFRMPFNGSAVSIRGKKLPICSFLHGSSGFVTSEIMGYDSASLQTGIVGELCKTGCIVFDVNGMGVSYGSGLISKHWGSPIAVETMKKAYEIIVNRFNGRRGMVVSAISMGGALAKSYTMTYPEDVIACALEAPSEIGLNCRYNDSQSKTEAVANAWGYVSGDAMLADHNKMNFVGFSPCITPNVIGQDGNIQKMDVDDYITLQSFYDNINNFVGAFPKETKIWHGNLDNNVPLEYSILFTNTSRNAGCNVTLRVCQNCEHSLNNYPWVMSEVVNYIADKLRL